MTKSLTRDYLGSMGTSPARYIVIEQRQLRAK
jgi:hypothetical protein